jgi:hypothetical protein
VTEHNTQRFVPRQIKVFDLDRWIVWDNHTAAPVADVVGYGGEMHRTEATCKAVADRLSKDHSFPWPPANT